MTAPDPGHDLGISNTAPAGRHSAFVPLLLLWLTLMIVVGSQLALQLRDRQQLLQAESNLGPQEAAATKVRAALDAVATATAGLADQGNANARNVVQQLRAHGVTIQPPRK